MDASDSLLTLNFSPLKSLLNDLLAQIRVLSTRCDSLESSMRVLSPQLQLSNLSDKVENNKNHHDQLMANLSAQIMGIKDKIEENKTNINPNENDYKEKIHQIFQWKEQWEKEREKEEEKKAENPKKNEKSLEETLKEMTKITERMQNMEHKMSEMATKQQHQHDHMMSIQKHHYESQSHPHQEEKHQHQQHGISHSALSDRISSLESSISSLHSSLHTSLNDEFRRFEKDAKRFITTQTKKFSSSLPHPHPIENSNPNSTAIGVVSYRCLTCSSVVETMSGPKEVHSPHSHREIPHHHQRKKIPQQDILISAPSIPSTNHSSTSSLSSSPSPPPSSLPHSHPPEFGTSISLVGTDNRLYSGREGENLGEVMRRQRSPSPAKIPHNMSREDGVVEHHVAFGASMTKGPQRVWN